MPKDYDDDWVSADDVAALNLERALDPNETAAQLTERLLTDAAPQAAMAIIGIINNPMSNDRVRLTASQYVIDRACGRVGDPRTEDGKAPWDGIFGAVTREAEEVLKEAASEG